MRRAGCWLTVLVPLAAWSVEAAAQDPSNEIYREDRVATYRLTMSAASWNAICNDGGGVGDTWQRADMTWQSDTVLGVGVKRSGVGTRDLDTPKPPLRISFNEFEFANPAGPGTPGRKWRGVNRIKLDSMIGNTDQAMMRDRVAYGICRDAGAPAPRACHARLYVNGSFKGLYTVEEPVRDDFLQLRFGEESGNLYKSEGFDEFAWRGTSASSYIPDPWIAEANYPGGDYRDLVTLIDIANHAPASEIRTRLSNHINLDGFLRHLAMEAVYGDSDGFNNWGSGGSNNHYWYHRASSNRMEVIKWDPGASQGMYEASNGFAKGQSPLGHAYDRSAVTRWIKNDATAWPTLKTKIRAILDGPMTGIQPRIDSIYNQIKNHAYEDPLKGAHVNDPAGFTDAEFDAAVAWLKDWYVKRIAYLRTQVGGSTLPTVTIAATDSNAAEPSSVGVFTVTRSGSTSASLAVSLSRTGTATSGSDYTGVGTSVTIAAGQSSATITVTPVDDSLVEGNETVVLTIASGTGYTVGSPSSATVNLADNDSAPTVPVVTVTASDPSGSEPSGTIGFTVSRTGSTASALTVTFTRGGTATNGTDYTSIATSVTIPAGSASAVVPATVLDDSTDEPDETVILTLSTGAAYTVGSPSSATATVLDNDTAALPTVTVTASDPSAAEPSNVGVFTITRTGSTAASLTVNVAAGGTATSGSDYTALPSAVTIAAGQTSAAVTVTPVDNTAAEPSETVILTVSASAAYTVGSPSNATVTLADNDTPGTTTVSFQDGVAPSAAYAGTRDTSLSENAPTAILGADASLRVDGDEASGSDRVALLRWNLSSIPPGSVIQSATLAFNVTSPSTEEYPVYQAKSDWAEGAATWTVYADGAPWQTAGAQGSLDRGTTVLGTLAPTAAGPYVLTLNAAGIALVQSWVDMPATNFGFVIAHASNMDGVVFDSREAAAATDRPHLTVTHRPGSAGTGLSATYYDNPDFTGTSVTRTDPAIDFNWAGGSPAPAIGADTFSARWTGRVRAQYGETYTFTTFTNDGVRLWVDGELLVDRWVQQSGGIEWSAQIDLEAGRFYTVQMEYYENLGNAVARLLWSSPSTPRQVIPQSALDPALGTPDSRDNDEDGIPNDTDLDDDNDGIPDLEDSDRDGDGASNVVEGVARTDPNDRTSTPITASAGGGGGGGGGCGATGLETLLVMAALALLRSRARLKT